MSNIVFALVTRVFVVCTTGLLISANPAAAKHRDVLPDMTSLLSEQHVASASVAVIRDGRIVSKAAWGTAGPNRPATVSTPYNLASLTKPLTAEVVLRLVSAGKISLDEPMDQYWSDSDLSSDPRRKMLTARMALSHRTGFPNWRSGTGLVFDHDPGTTTGYSGEGYQYVARYAEHRTRTPFAQLAQEQLFRPARLDTIGYVSAQGSQDPIAIGYDAAGKPLTLRNVTQYNAADLAHATAGDYARFLIDVRSDRHLTPELAVERSHLQADQRPDVCAGVKAESCPPWIGFGLGWQLLGFPNGTVMMHTGRDEGAFTFAEIDRATGDGIVILTNSDQGWRLILPLLERTKANPTLIRYLHAQID
jgi:CubicO group peptidase (beta-lactamase class C family)